MPQVVLVKNGVFDADTMNAINAMFASLFAATISGLVIASGKTVTFNKTLTFTGTDGVTVTLPSSDDTLAGLAAVQTLTNKRITRRVVTAANGIAITPNTDNADITYQANTQVEGTLTINADTGTPTNGQSWILKVKSTNVQTFAFNAVFSGGTAGLPTATSGGAVIDYFAFMYDAVNSKWDYQGASAGF